MDESCGAGMEGVNTDRPGRASSSGFPSGDESLWDGWMDT